MEAGQPFAATMQKTRFLGRSGSAAQFADRAISFLPDEPSLAILDLGCGIGDLAIALKERRPASHVAGIDFSPANVEAAKAQTDGIAFHLGDYLRWQGGTFDMIVADSVLHLIDAPIDLLAKKLTADLKPGGVLVGTVPSDTLRNRALLLLRRLYRRTPAVTDKMALRLAVLLHPDVPAEVLADRMPYMRDVPRLFGKLQRSALDRAGLRLEHSASLKNPSLAKPKHVLMVWRRRPVAV